MNDSPIAEWFIKKMKNKSISPVRPCVYCKNPMVSVTEPPILISSYNIQTGKTSNDGRLCILISCNRCGFSSIFDLGRIDKDIQKIVNDMKNE